MTTSFDAVVVGAGHNGLVAAALLARAGRRVLVLERRREAGGIATTYEFAPGFRASVAPELDCLLLPQVVEELELEKHGLGVVPLDPLVHVLPPEGEPLTLWRDEAKSLEAIRRCSSRDAEAWPRFSKLVRQLGDYLRSHLSRPVPLPEVRGVKDLVTMLKLGWDVRRMGARPMHELLRALPMSVADFLDEWLETEALKAALAAPALLGVCLGPRSSGTAARFLCQQAGDGDAPLGSRRLVRGGFGGLTRCLVASLEAHGGEVRTAAAVERIDCQKGRATGVGLESGEAIGAPTVLSCASPRATFLELVDPGSLEPDFVQEIESIRYRGVTARLHLALEGLPDFGRSSTTDGEAALRGVVQFGASLDELEQAYDAAKYGAASKRPFLSVVVPTLHDPELAPPGKHVMSITMQYAPYRLRQGSWDDHREELTRRILETLAERAPDLERAVVHHHLVTPLDYETEYGLPEGSLHQGEMALDQMFFMRPVPGWARYETPIEGLYLCGSSTHPGGGITGACGYNAARQVLKLRR